jgi:hypothetical protein
LVTGKPSFAIADGGQSGSDRSAPEPIECLQSRFAILDFGARLSRDAARNSSRSWLAKDQLAHVVERSLHLGLRHPLTVVDHRQSQVGQRLVLGPDIDEIASVDRLNI